MLREMEDLWMSEMDLMTEGMWNAEGMEKMASGSAIAATATPVTKKMLLESTDFCFDKWSDEKLALNIDDVSMCFDDLVKGLEPDATDILPASPVWEAPEQELVEKKSAIEQEEEQVEQSETKEAWIQDLEDASNVNDLCEMFEVLVEDENQLMNQAFKATEKDEDDQEEDDEDEDMTSSEDEDDVQGKEPVFGVDLVPVAPAWIPCTPLDPRSCIRTPVFTNLDPRIPQISVPRIDLGFSKSGLVHPGLCMAAPKPKVTSSVVATKKQDVHDPSTCWICKSKSSPERKRALHRYQEKKSRRIWTRGPRYKGRSVVASVRVRNGGRFTCGAQWI